MRLPPAPGDAARRRTTEVERWLTVGSQAALSVLRQPPAGVALETADGVHEALDALALAPYARVLVAPEALAPRPRAALRALLRRCERERVALLGPRPSPRVLRAARALGVTVVTAALDLAAAPAPSTGPGAAEDEGAPPAAPARARAQLPRADRAGDESPVDVGRFAEGCLARLERPGALAGYLIRTLAEASDAARVSLMLAEGGGRSLVLRAGRGIDPALLGKVRVPLGSGVAGRAATLGRPLTGQGSSGGARGYAGGAYVVLPLGREGACEGVLSLTGFPHDRLPAPATLEAWVHLVRRAGQALRSARRLRRAEVRSARDALTGLPNRRAFERALARELERARRAQRGLGVAIVDVDRFKALNDGHGHDAGDRALAEVAQRLAGALRDTDLVARWGGEEFALLLPDLAPGGEAEAPAAVERARRAVSARPVSLGLGRPSVTVTISGGVVLGPGPSGDGPGLLHAADLALLEAKQAGRDRILSARRA